MSQSEAYKLGRQKMDSFRSTHCAKASMSFPTYTITKNSRLVVQSMSSRCSETTYAEATYRSEYGILESDEAWEDFSAGLDV